MGVLGVELYDDDIACDILNIYQAALTEGVHTRAAYEDAVVDKQAHKRAKEACLAELSDDPETDALIWFVLADIQWGYGVLEEDVKNNALAYFARDEHLEGWKEAGETLFLQRMEVLRKLKEKITSPQPQKTEGFSELKEKITSPQPQKTEGSSELKESFFSQTPGETALFASDVKDGDSNLKKDVSKRTLIKNPLAWEQFFRSLIVFTTIFLVVLGFVIEIIHYMNGGQAGAVLIIYLPIVTGVALIALIVFWIVLSAKRKQSFHLFRYWPEDGIYVKLSAIFQPAEKDFGFFKELKEPVYIDGTGIYLHENTVFLWEKCEVWVRTSKIGIYNTPIKIFVISSMETQDRLCMEATVMNYALIKRFCLAPVHGIEDLDADDQFKKLNKEVNQYTMPENKQENKQDIVMENAEKTFAAKAVPADDALKVNSFFWLICIGFFVVGMAIVVGIAVALALNGLVGGGGFLGALIGVALVGLARKIFHNFPKGTTYIDKNNVYNKQLFEETTLAVEETNVEISGMFITFSIVQQNEQLKKIIIFNTEKARELIKTLPFRSVFEI